MPKETLLKALEDDARARCAEIIEEAERAAGEMVAAVEQEADSDRRKRLEAVALKMDRLHTSLVNAARVRTNARMLKVRHEIIDGVLGSVVEHFRGMSGKEYSGLINILYDEVIREVACHGENPVVYAHPDDVEHLPCSDAESKGDHGVSLGVVLTDSDRRITARNTVEERIKKARKTLVPRLDRLLFT
jgi:vacuolar-type H+-ATPase subunit E/Vma4